MKLTLTSATAALKAVKGGLVRFLPVRCLVLLLVTTAFSPARALPQKNGRSGTHNKGSHTLPQAPGELQQRLGALDSAKSTDNPDAIANASRRVISLALRNSAEVALAQGNASQAIQTYRRSLDFEDVPATHVELALGYLIAGHPGQALSQVTDVLVAEPQNALAWRVEGQVWMAKGSYRQASESLRKSAALQPSPETNRLLRIALAHAGKQAKSPPQTPWLLPTSKFTPAEFHARQRRLKNILGSALNDLGTAEARQQQFPLALAHFHEAEQWQADTPGLMRNIGMAAARTGDYAEAARALTGVVTVDPGDSVARSMLGMALFTTGSYGEAAHAFKPLGDSVLDRPELAYAWAESLVKVNRYDEAGALLGKLEARPLAAGTRILVAQAWSEMGNYPRAVAACRRALQAEPTLIQAHYIAGLALIHEDRPVEAAAEFRAQLRQDPVNSDAEYHLAFVLFQLSQEQEALQHLRNVLARDPNHPDANYELGKWLLKAGKTADAIPYLEAAARLKPELDAVHYQLQSAYRSVGRKADADREAGIYRAMKAKSRNITLPPPRQPQSQ